MLSSPSRSAGRQPRRPSLPPLLVAKHFKLRTRSAEHFYVETRHVASLLKPLRSYKKALPDIRKGSLVVKLCRAYFINTILIVLL
jgi:hypothetical protein